MSAPNLVLVVNAGSSSLKLRLLDRDDRLVRQADLPADAAGFDTGALTATLDGWPAPDVIGHRIVHGGTEFSRAVALTPAVADSLSELTELAPLHQPKSLAALAAVSAVLAGTPAVACFDTAFHAGLPAAAATYPVPQRWRERYLIRRFGFHGLSHAYAARRGAQLIGANLERLRVISCHLGAGASLCAVLGGRSVDTTMGFTPLDGLVMATRSGSIDPGLILWLAEHKQLAPSEIADTLEHHSGMLALAGSADQRVVEQRAAAGDERAKLAVQVYLHRLVAGIAAMAAATGGLDLLVFTAGVGENSPLIRAGAAERLGWLGVAIEADRNAATTGDGQISASGSAVRTVVVSAREDLEIARQARQVVAGG